MHTSKNVVAVPSSGCLCNRLKHFNYRAIINSLCIKTFFGNSNGWGWHIGLQAYAPQWMEEKKVYLHHDSLGELRNTFVVILLNISQYISNEEHTNGCQSNTQYWINYSEKLTIPIPNFEIWLIIGFYSRVIGSCSTEKKVSPTLYILCVLFHKYHSTGSKVSHISHEELIIIHFQNILVYVIVH